jgi:triosephosphate isomerase
LLYGGSVKTDNAYAILSLPNVDGLLVGGASLLVDSFCGILEAAERAYHHKSGLPISGL